MNKFIAIFSFSLLLNQLYGLDITFRYVEKTEDNFVRVFVPGTMPNGTVDDWGPNNNGLISPGEESEMTYNTSTDCYEKSYSLNINTEHFYKLHFHHNDSGSNNSWISDPFNTEVTNDQWANSILNVTDPLFFQPVRHSNNEGLVDGFSIGLFTSGIIDDIKYYTGNDTLNGMDYLDSNGVFYINFSIPITIYDPIFVQVTIDGQIYIVYDVDEIVVEQELLPDGVNIGPTWLNETMYVSIYAPGQPFMRINVGEPGFNSDLSNTILMKKDPSLEDIWWIELDLPLGTYEYEYILPNGNSIIDPLSRRISNNKTRIDIGPGGISTADDFQWEANDYIRPEMDTLVIYELQIDDFASIGNGQGKFDNVIQKLDHLKEIGINAIEILPVFDFPGTHSWGYDPILLSAVESNYGTPEDFKRLVDEAHKKGIAIILDIVWNHIRSASPIWEVQPDYNLNPYIKIHTQLNPNEAEGSWGMLDLDHFNEKTIEYINKVNKIWVEEYKIDGFRFDAMYMIGWDMQQQQYGIPAWSNALSQSHPTIYQIAEHLPSNPWLIDNTNLSSGWHDSFHDVLLRDAHGQYNSTLTYMRQVIGLHEYSNSENSYSSLTNAVKYMISHDEQSIIQEMTVFNNYSLEEAQKRDQFYASILFTSRGIPMLFQGQEFGLQTGWTDSNNNNDYEEKLQYRPMDWSVLESESGQEHMAHYSKLAKLRKKNPAFSKGIFYDLWRYENDKVLVYGYKDESEENNNDQVVIVANFSTSEKLIQDVPFLSSGTWYNILEPGNNIIIENMSLPEYSIARKTAIIFTNQNWSLETKESKLIPKKASLITSYPNPFNGQIRINYSTNFSSIGEISIFDISGRMVFSINDIHFNQGDNFFNWNGESQTGYFLPTGLYIVSVKDAEKLNNHKILYLK